MTSQNFVLGLSLLLALFGGLANSTSLNITSPPITDWGVWGRFERCPNGTYVQGFQLRTQKFQGPFVDDTAVNSIRLYCGEPFNPNTPAITSGQGNLGDWGSVYSCYPGFINGFQLRVEPNLNSGDDTATNNLRVFCSNQGDPNQYIEGDGLSFGIWGETRRCFSDQAFCGLQTQIENCDTASKTNLISSPFCLFANLKISIY